MSLDAASMTAMFLRLGLDPVAAEQTAKSSKVGPLLVQICTECGVAETGCDRSIGVCLYTLASRLTPQAASFEHRKLALDAIMRGDIRSSAQCDAAVNFLKQKPADFKADNFASACGIGVTWTHEQIVEAIRNVIKERRSVLESDRYRAVPQTLGMVNSRVMWADGKTVKAEFDREILELLGPKNESDMAPSAGKAKPAKVAQPAKASTSTKETTEPTSQSTASPSYLSLPFSSDDPDAVKQWLATIDGREVAASINTPEQLARHREVVREGCVRSRFPPEPNGYLHLGHAKAMNFNFGLAKLTNGECIMRFDDTNPEAEKTDYINSILGNLEWLGHKPAQVTYSSDYFPQLYRLAVKMIETGYAYVDHQTAAEIKVSRDERKAGRDPIPSPWRDRPIEESLRLFEEMRQGRFDEGEATLRMKGDLYHSNPQMWDIVAYRIKYAAHPHVGDKWCIYPSYDYTHCIVDSLENITHSCCTLEFEVRRESYFWLLDVLDLYKPRVWEYSRLNMEYNVMSKRRLLTLVVDNHVTGWDDPRLLTLDGLKRRGYSPRAITDFCNSIGISRNETMIPMEKLEFWCRNDLEQRAQRAMVVVDPVKVILENYDEKKVEMMQAPNMPKDPSQGTHDIPLTRVIYIDRQDVRLKDDKSFFGMSLNKEVHLKYAYNITATKIEVDPSNPEHVTLVHAKVDFANSNKPKGKLHWVAEPQPGVAPLKVELRLYDRLFLSQDPMSLDNWLTDLNPDSLHTVTNAYADPSIKSAAVGAAFQFERVAFFVVDPDTTKSVFLSLS